MHVLFFFFRSSLMKPDIKDHSDFQGQSSKKQKILPLNVSYFTLQQDILLIFLYHTYTMDGSLISEICVYITRILFGFMQLIEVELYF
jgi:hypothetical protein